MWAAPDFPLRRGPFAASRARVRMSVPWPAGAARKRHGRPPSHPAGSPRARRMPLT